MDRWKGWIIAVGLCGWASGALAEDGLSNILPYTPPTASEKAWLVQDAARLLQTPPTSLANETDLACMAVAVYHEARGESIKGQRAVASVVLQRTMVPDRWGRTACDVVRPVQFTFMQGDQYGDPTTWTYASIRNPAAWETALRVALTITFQGPDAYLQGADHYHTTQVFPTWRLAMDMTEQVGNHKFYVDPISIKKVAEAGINPLPNVALAGYYDWSGEGTPTVGDGVRGLPQGVVQDLYTDGWADPKQLAVATPDVGGFQPVRGPDVDAIAQAQAMALVDNAAQGRTIGLQQGQPVGNTMGLPTPNVAQPIDIAQNGFRPLGFGKANP